MAIYNNKANQDRLMEERRFYRQMMDQATNAANQGSSWGQGGAGWHAQSATAGGLLRAYPQRGLTMKWGEAGNEKQLDQFIAQQKGRRRGPNRGLVPGQSTTNRRREDVMRAAGTKEKKDAETAIEKFFRQAEEKIEEANNANAKRRDQILGELDARYNRVMDRIGNFGVAARADLQERAAEALGNIHANLSARGLGNSTVLAAFTQRNARDLAREQQRLSETVDTRAMNADMQMTADRTGFLERIQEDAPNWGQLQEMAMKYAMGNEGRGFNTGDTAQGLPPGQGAVINDYRNQGGGSWAPPPGAVAAGRNRGPMFLNGFNPMGILNSMVGRGAYRVPWNAPVNNDNGPQDANYASPAGPANYKEYYEPGETDVPNKPQTVGDFIQDTLNPQPPYPQSRRPLPGPRGLANPNEEQSDQFRNAQNRAALAYPDKWAESVGDILEGYRYGETGDPYDASRRPFPGTYRDEMMNRYDAGNMAKRPIYTPPDERRAVAQGGKFYRDANYPRPAGPENMIDANYPFPAGPIQNPYPFPKDQGMIPPPTNRTPSYQGAEAIVNSWRPQQMPMSLPYRPRQYQPDYTYGM